MRLNPDGNERLTAAVGVLLLVPILAELGDDPPRRAHIHVAPRLRRSCLDPARAVEVSEYGLALCPLLTDAVAATLAHGPLQLALRLLAPLLVAATVVLFGSGVAMGILHGHALQIARRLHGPASVIWLPAHRHLRPRLPQTRSDQQQRNTSAKQQRREVRGSDVAQLRPRGSLGHRTNGRHFHRPRPTSLGRPALPPRSPRQHRAEHRERPKNLMHRAGGTGLSGRSTLSR